MCVDSLQIGSLVSHYHHFPWNERQRDFSHTAIISFSHKDANQGKGNYLSGRTSFLAWHYWLLKLRVFICCYFNVCLLFPLNCSAHWSIPPSYPASDLLIWGEKLTYFQLAEAASRTLILRAVIMNCSLLAGGQPPPTGGLRRLHLCFYQQRNCWQQSLCLAAWATWSFRTLGLFY